MADVEHAEISDPGIHEPKDASTALANEIKVITSAGVGTFELPTTSQAGAHKKLAYIAPIVNNIGSGITTVQDVGGSTFFVALQANNNFSSIAEYINNWLQEMIDQGLMESS